MLYFQNSSIKFQHFTTCSHLYHENSGINLSYFIFVEDFYSVPKGCDHFRRFTESLVHWKTRSKEMTKMMIILGGGEEISDI